MMPDTVANKMKSIEPSLAVMVCRALGERSLAGVEDSWRLFLVSEKVSTRNTRGEKGRLEGEGKGSSGRGGVLARDMAAAKA